LVLYMSATKLFDLPFLVLVHKVQCKGLSI
jgi:hypothetical protein